jgi:hypothetical protein
MHLIAFDGAKGPMTVNVIQIITMTIADTKLSILICLNKTSYIFPLL